LRAGLFERGWIDYEVLDASAGEGGRVLVGRRGTLSMSMMSRVTGKPIHTLAAGSVLSLVYIDRPMTTGQDQAARQTTACFF